MFPNVLSGEKYDAFAADLWSMGIFLYEMATGELPYKAGTYEELKEMWKSRKFNYPSHVKLSSCLKDLIDKMIVKGNITFQELLDHPFVSASQQEYKQYVAQTRKAEDETLQISKDLKYERKNLEILQDKREVTRIEMEQTKEELTPM